MLRIFTPEAANAAAPSTPSTFSTTPSGRVISRRFCTATSTRPAAATVAAVTYWTVSFIR